MEEEKFLTAPEAAKLLKISSQTLRRWSEKGVLIPHHILPSGYRYYSEQQIKDFLQNSEVDNPKANVVTNKKVTKTNRKEKKNTIKNVPQEKPLFRLYVDSGAGKTWVNYYSMRSGKTNALIFANNQKLFHQSIEFVGEQELVAENNEYKFEEPMHSVTITLDGQYIENVTVAIAKGIFWIQLIFTNKLGCNHPPDSVIEEARYMRWKIDDYMKFCGLSSRSRAIESIKKILTLLSHAEIQWQEEVIVRDDNGQPVYSGKYRDKNGNFVPKLKKALHTYRGAFIATRDIEPIHGAFEFWINKEFATYLAHAGVIAVHENFFRLDSQKNHHAITLAAKLLEYNGINHGTKQAGILSVKTLLNAMPSIPKYESLTSCQTVKKSDGQLKTYEKHGNKGGWTTRILKPFSEAFNALVDMGILVRWYYRDNREPANYNDFISQFVCFEFAVQIADIDNLSKVD